MAEKSPIGTSDQAPVAGLRPTLCMMKDVIVHSSESFWISGSCEDSRGGGHLVFDQGCESINLWLGKDAIVLIFLICASANRQVELDWMQSDCRRFCSGQSTLAQQASTEISTI